MDTIIDDASVGLRVHVSGRLADAEALRARLDRSRAEAGKAGGEVSLIAALENRSEVEIRLPGRYRLDASVRGALKSAPGVVLLEDA